MMMINAHMRLNYTLLALGSRLLLHLLLLLLLRRQILRRGAPSSVIILGRNQLQRLRQNRTRRLGHLRDD